MIITNAAEKYVSDLLMERALSKFRMGGLATSLLSQATYKMKESGSWTDDVMIYVFLDAGSKDKTRCNRLIHGIPSPRFWHGASNTHCLMPAIDVVYFFANDYDERLKAYKAAIPEFPDTNALEYWLNHFTSRKFNRELIDMLLTEADRNMPKASPSSYRGILSGQVLQRVANMAAEIDRFAWYKGYRTMSLAKAAPMLKLDTPVSTENRAKRMRPAGTQPKSGT